MHHSDTVSADLWQFHDQIDTIHDNERLDATAELLKRFLVSSGRACSFHRVEHLSLADVEAIERRLSSRIHWARVELRDEVARLLDRIGRAASTTNPFASDLRFRRVCLCACSTCSGNPQHQSRNSTAISGPLRRVRRAVGLNDEQREQMHHEILPKLRTAERERRKCTGLFSVALERFDLCRIMPWLMLRRRNGY